MKLLIISLLVFISCLFIVRSASCTESERKPSLRGVSGLDVPGYEQYSFSVEKGGKSIQVLMKLNKTLLTMETSIQYNRYVHRDENANMAEFRYYKSCITAGLVSPSYSISEERITLVLGDTFEAGLLYSFKLDKVEVSAQEKIDLMFNVMNKDISDLKESLWFLTPGENKIAKGRSIQSNNPKMIDFIEGRTATYSGIYNDATITSMESGSCVVLLGDKYYYSGSSGCSSIRHTYSLSGSNSPLSGFSSQPVSIQFPRSATIKKIRFEIANGGACPYSDSITFYIKRYYIVAGKFTNMFSYSSYYTWNVKILEDPVHTNSKTKLTDGFVEYEFETDQHYVVDGIVLFITTKGFRSPSGTEFDTRCNYVIRNLSVI